MQFNEFVSTKESVQSVGTLKSLLPKGSKLGLFINKDDLTKRPVVIINRPDSTTPQSVVVSAALAPLVRSGQVKLSMLANLPIMEGKNGGHFIGRPGIGNTSIEDIASIEDFDANVFASA